VCVCMYIYIYIYMCVCVCVCVCVYIYVGFVVHFLDPVIHTEVHSVQFVFVGIVAYLV
jgi:hypothetical protein